MKGKPSTPRSPEPAHIQVVSVNTQGSKPAVLTALRQRVASATEPTFAVIQESGAPPSGWGLVQHPDDPRLSTGVIAGRQGSRQQPVYVAVQKPEGRKAKSPSRNSQTVFSNAPFEEVSQLPAGRRGPGLRDALVTKTDDALVATVHQPSKKPAFAAAQTRDQWQAFKERAEDEGLPGMMVGDYNLEHPRLHATVAPRGGTVLSPNVATHQAGRTLDHAVTTDPLGTVQMGTAMAGDHWPVEYTMRRNTARRAFPDLAAVAQAAGRAAWHGSGASLVADGARRVVDNVGAGGTWAGLGAGVVEAAAGAAVMGSWVALAVTGPTRAASSLANVASRWWYS